MCPPGCLLGGVFLCVLRGQQPPPFYSFIENLWYVRKNGRYAVYCVLYSIMHKADKYTVRPFECKT
jgi:hypothetical protein